MTAEAIRNTTSNAAASWSHCDISLQLSPATMSAVALDSCEQQWRNYRKEQQRQHYLASTDSHAHRCEHRTDGAEADSGQDSDRKHLEAKHHEVEQDGEDR